MKYVKCFIMVAFFGICLVAAAPAAQAQIGVGIGVDPGYVGDQPVCDYGYYSYYPYACAPYGFYGSNWFSGGVFIGTGPWYGWGWGGGRGYGNGGYGGRGYGNGGRGYGNGGRGYGNGGYGNGGRGYGNGGSVMADAGR